MPTAEARIPTPRASRYLTQLCGHLDRLQHLPDPATGTEHAGDGMPQVRHVEWTDTHATVTLADGRWTLEATPDTLRLHIDAPDEHTLRRTQDSLASRLQQIGRRDRLTVTWQDTATNPTPTEKPVRTGSTSAGSTGADVTQPGATRVAGGHRSRRGTAVLFAALAVLAIGVHVAVANTALGDLRWTGWAASAVLLIVAVKLTALALGGRALRHRMPQHGPRQ